MPYYLRDDEASAADLAGQAVTLARAAGATFQLANHLLGHGGWRARLADATTADVFSPLAESLDLWERLRIPWGRVAVIEEIAQALAIRGNHKEAFVLWGAADASGIQVAAKVGRARRTDPYIADLPAEQTGTWYSQGAAMTLDHAVAFARTVVTAALSRPPAQTGKALHQRGDPRPPQQPHSQPAHGRSGRGRR